MAIPQGLLGRQIGRLVVAQISKQPVGGGDDVLNFRAGLRFEQRQGVDQDRGIREQCCSLFQLGDRRPGGDAPLQNRLRL